MKKDLAVLLVVLFGASIAVQAQPFTKGTNVVSVGIGLGSSFGGFGYGSQTPAISAQYEKGMWAIDGPGVISLGGFVGFKSYKYSNTYATQFTYNQKWSYTVIGVRSAYHYNGLKTDKFDVYGGLMLSYDIVNYSYTDNRNNGVRFDNGSYGSGIGFSAYVGGRYFFAHNLAAFAELGFGVAILNIGVAFKF